MIIKPQLDQLLPHSGSMSLLDSVTEWDPNMIVATTRSHQSLDNPLRKDDQLSSMCAIEYAAQAMAIHRTLIAKQHDPSAIPRVGYLASASKVKLNVDRFDTLDGELTVKVTCLTGSDDGSLYEFSTMHGSYECASGQALVLLAQEDTP